MQLLFSYRRRNQHITHGAVTGREASALFCFSRRSRSFSHAPGHQWADRRPRSVHVRAANIHIRARARHQRRFIVSPSSAVPGLSARFFRTAPIPDVAPVRVSSLPTQSFHSETAFDCRRGKRSPGQCDTTGTDVSHRLPGPLSARIARIRKIRLHSSGIHYLMCQFPHIQLYGMDTHIYI